MSAHPSVTIPAAGAISGRAAAIARRQALSAGKAALPPPKERVRHGEGSPGERRPPQSVVPAAGTPALTAAATALAPERTARFEHSSCREQARARRALRCTCGRGEAAPAAPSRPPRQGRLQYAPKVVESTPQSRRTVTGLGLGLGRGSQVTGVEAGAGMPVSGTQYVGLGEGAAARSGGPKVGHARTAHGGIVSGTLVRSRVRITGDEAGGTVTITGEADQRPEDDLTARNGDGVHVAAQFQRQFDPHGHRVFGINLRRGAANPGSRERRREAPLESTENGRAITGSALGRATRVTGDEDGACRHVTGDQYLSPARTQAECGGQGGGTAPVQQQGNARRDPVTGAKVSAAQTWARQRVTGCDIEHNPLVSGDAAGSCALITGTPYQGAGTMEAWCDPAAADAATERLPRRAGQLPVTGDAPIHADRVTGTARGAARAITGTPYFRPAVAVDLPEDPIAAIDQRFSLRSPQRTAQLKVDRSGAGAPGADRRITGAFALSAEKVTGNLEFLFKPRREIDTQAKPAHLRLTGEGRSVGGRISGYSWADQSKVTGTEGSTAADRNPSERGGKAQSFAGAVRFKSLVQKEEHKQLVTGMAGWSSKSAARVTLSGGAQG